ncbi:uncharacterized protein LOC130727443 [Lotus japonicus]|uniref:uncharacterized protein LOC130727443 n=1 Tax=Lotus japonicus TaxID=34305 RepID=UPI00258F2D6D|nr:uncharacterized protein LOC130727443 [Lotus japonicus]
MGLSREKGSNFSLGHEGRRINDRREKLESSRGNKRWRFDHAAEPSWRKQHHASTPSNGRYRQVSQHSHQKQGHGSQRGSEHTMRFSPTTLFIDGLTEKTSYEQVKNAFKKWGKLSGVFVQRTKKRHRRTKFGFVHFVSKEAAARATRNLNGGSLNGATISVAVAKYPTNAQGDTHPTANRWTNHVRKRVWRRKTEPISQEKESSDYSCCYNTKQEDLDRVQRMAVASLRGVRNIEEIQNFLIAKGYSRIKVKALGAKEVVLEFENRDEMLSFLLKGVECLADKCECISEASMLAKPTRHFIWVTLRNVPIAAWHTRFFSSIAGLFGIFVCLDKETESHSRYDRARMLIVSSLPSFQSRSINIKIDEEVVAVALEMDIKHEFCEPPFAAEEVSGFSSSEGNIANMAEAATSDDSRVQGTEDIDLPSATSPAAPYLDESELNW